MKQLFRVVVNCQKLATSWPKFDKVSSAKVFRDNKVPSSKQYGCQYFDKFITSSSGSTSLLPQQTITILYAGQRTRPAGNGQQRLITNGARKLAPNHQEAPWGPSSRTPLLTAVLNYRGVPFHTLSLAMPRDRKPLMCLTISR